MEEYRETYKLRPSSLDWLQFKELYRWLHLLGSSLTEVEMAASLDTGLAFSGKSFDDYSDMVKYNRVLKGMKMAESADVSFDYLLEVHQILILDFEDDMNFFHPRTFPPEYQLLCEEFNTSQRKVMNILSFCEKMYSLKPFKRYSETTVRAAMNYLLLGNGYILCTQVSCVEFNGFFKKAVLDNLIENYEFFIKHGGIRKVK